MANIYLAGHRGMVGSAISQQLADQEGHEIMPQTHTELDLTIQLAVCDFMHSEQLDVVILAAAKAGGIHANNTYLADFIYQNIMIECNVIYQAFKAGVTRLLQLGSSCIYPRPLPQPMREDALLTGTLEPTNEPYAITKIAWIKFCESYNYRFGVDYRSVMPTNRFCPEDNFHPENSYVLPALICRLNELAQMVAKITGYSGWIATDTTKLDGALHKLTDMTRMKSMGWQAKVLLEDGVSETYSWFLQNKQSLRG